MSEAHAPAPAAEPRRRQATQWFVAHESGQPLAPDQLSQWDAWIDDPKNRAEYIAIADLHFGVLRISRPLLPSQDELLQDDFDVGRPPVDLRCANPAVGSTQRTRGTWPRFRVALLSAAAALIIVALLAAIRAFLPPTPTSQAAQIYATRAGEQREVTLADGSVMTLGADSAVTVRFTSTGRSIMLTRGEGMFHVQHEAKRPFLVCAAQACVRAVGTVFDVRVYSNRIHIWVQEGVVQVAPSKMIAPDNEIIGEVPHWTPQTLAHGQEMSYSARGGEVSAPKPADTHIAAAWTQGTLTYRGRPLAEVVEDVQRYIGRPLLLDPAIGDLQYSGSVVQERVGEWIRRLPDIYPVEIVDCRSPAELNSRAVRAIAESCTTNPDRILVRARVAR